MKMGLSPIQPIKNNTMLNNNGMNIGDWLNFVTCKQTLMSLKPNWWQEEPSETEQNWFACFVTKKDDVTLFKQTPTFCLHDELIRLNSWSSSKLVCRLPLTTRTKMINPSIWRPCRGPLPPLYTGPLPLVPRHVQTYLIWISLYRAPAWSPLLILCTGPAPSVQNPYSWTPYMFKRVQLGHHCIGPQPGSSHPYTVLGLHPSMTPAFVPLRDMFKRAQLLDLIVQPPLPNPGHVQTCSLWSTDCVQLKCLPVLF